MGEIQVCGPFITGSSRGLAHSPDKATADEDASTWLRTGDVAVIAVPDARWSERPLACVVCKPGHAVAAAVCSVNTGRTVGQDLGQAPARYTLAVCISTWCSVMQVSKWGNSLAIRLPAAVVEVLNLKEGDDVDILVAGARALQVRGGRARDAEVLARLRAFRGTLPADFKFDRLEANARGG